MTDETEAAARALIDMACAGEVPTTRLLVLQQCFRYKWYAALPATRVAEIGAVLMAAEYTPQLQIRVNKELRLLVKEKVLRKTKNPSGVTLYELNLGES